MAILHNQSKNARAKARAEKKAKRERELGRQKRAKGIKKEKSRGRAKGIKKEKKLAFEASEGQREGGRTPAEAYGWGVRMLSEIAKKNGEAAAKEFVNSLLFRWKASKLLDDKKAYNGAKIALSQLRHFGPILSDENIPNAYNGIIFSPVEAYATIDYVNRIDRDVLYVELGLDIRAVRSIIGARPLTTINELAALHYVGKPVFYALRNEVNNAELGLERKEIEHTPSEAFRWGKRMAAKIGRTEGAAAVKEFVSKLRRQWVASKSVSDKKAYDGAKIALPSINKEIHLKNEKIRLEDPNEISYAVVSPSIASFAESFLEKYNLINLESVLDVQVPHNVPCVYFGCYKERDIIKIRNNKSNFKIIIYGGTDATKKKNLKILKNIWGLRHIAISDYIVEDLSKLGIPHEKVGITPVDHSKYNFKVEPLGSSVYVYNGSEAAAEVYGKKVYAKIINMMPDLDFKVCGHGDYSREDLINIYKDCFIGLRLIKHDGLPNTVVEMALMGRRVVHNGGLPSSISYDSIEDICNIIRKEQEKMGTSNGEIREETLRYLNNSQEWLKINFWKNMRPYPRRVRRRRR
jgi:hypothetical protein